MEGQLEGDHRGLPSQAVEPVSVKVSSGRDDGSRKDGPADAEQGAAHDERQDHDRRVELDRVTEHLRHQQVVLELLDRDVEQRGGRCGRERDRQADQDGRHGGDDRSDDGDELEEAGDQRQDERELPEFAEADDREDRQADDGGQEDRCAEQQLAANPAAPDPTQQGKQLLRVGPPPRWQRSGNGPRRTPHDP